MASVVQQWDEPNNTKSPFLTLAQEIEVEAWENGIVRPQGYDVSFHYNSDVEQHHFGRSHPMKPWRLHLTKQLVLSYGLQYAMDLYETREATKAELAEFHKQDYLEFLAQVTPENVNTSDPLYIRFNFGDDCPVFDGLYRYCSIYTGSTLSAAQSLITSTPAYPKSDIAINWSGGLHHAKKSEASGFCYINDIVLAILELLRVHPRVLYIDIDVHHGDGVEQAFASTDRVMTLSYHKYDPAEFFPGTGGLHETGPENPNNPGAHHSLNVPLHDGISDAQYEELFAELTGATIEHFAPTAVVLQCGADSLGGDRLGKFNLNIRSHGFCVSFVKGYRLPLLVLGGGGYTARNVARVWCHETSLCVGAELNDELPAHVPYRQAFEGEDNGNGLLYPELHNIVNKVHENFNTPDYLHNIKVKIHEQLRYLKGAPSVQMRRMPPDIWRLREELDDEVKDDLDAEEHDRRRKERNTGGRGELVY